MGTFVSEFVHTVFTPPFKYLFIVGFVLFVLGIIGRLMCGIRPGKNRSRTVSVCFMVIFMYVVSIVAFGTDAHMQIFSSALPFFSDMSDSVSLYMMMKNNFALFITEVAQLFAMTITISLVQVPFDNLASKAKGSFLRQILLSPILFYPWYIVECLILFLAMAVNVGIDLALTNWVNETFASVITVVFFVLVAVSLILLVLKVILGAVGFLAWPIFDLIHTFLFDNYFGQVIRKSFNSTIIITFILLVLDFFGYLTPLMTIIVPATVFAPVAILLIAIFYVTWVFLG